MLQKKVFHQKHVLRQNACCAKSFEKCFASETFAAPETFCCATNCVAPFFCAICLRQFFWFAPILLLRQTFFWLQTFLLKNNSECVEEAQKDIGPLGFQAAPKAQLLAQIVKAERSSMKTETKSEDGKQLPTEGVDTLPPAVTKVRLPSSKHLALTFHAGNVTYVTCTDEKENGLGSMQYGSLLVSWFKGKWWHNEKNGTLSDADVPFGMRDTDDLVLLNGKLQTLGKTLEDRRATKTASKCEVLYHELKDAPTDEKPGHQTLQLKHAMVWKPEPGATLKDPKPNATGGNPPEPPSMEYKHAAGAIPSKLWNTSLTAVVWSVRWATTGLAPIRPQVVLTQQLQVTRHKKDNKLKNEATTNDIYFFDFFRLPNLAIPHNPLFFWVARPPNA